MCALGIMSTMCSFRHLCIHLGCLHGISLGTLLDGVDNTPPKSIRLPSSNLGLSPALKPRSLPALLRRASLRSLCNLFDGTWSVSQGWCWEHTGIALPQVSAFGDSRRAAACPLALRGHAEEASTTLRLVARVHSHRVITKLGAHAVAIGLTV